MDELYMVVCSKKRKEKHDEDFIIFLSYYRNWEVFIKNLPRQKRRNEL